MKNVLGMLLNLFEVLGQTTDAEIKEAVGTFRDLFAKLNGKEAAVWYEALKKFLRKEVCWATNVAQAVAGDIVAYIVDCTVSLEDMIKAGNYDWVNSDITAKRFPVKSTGKDEWEFKIFHFDRNISSENAVTGITSDDATNPWQPAGIEHLLTYGKENPEEQRKYPIIGLGSVGKVNGHRYVPCLDRYGSKRYLDLSWWDDVWSAYCRFFAVRKKS